jgi:CBS domain-containing protein
MTLDQIARDKEDLVTASPDASIVDAAKMMADHDVGCIVVERDDEPVGIVTDRDLTVDVLAEGKDAKETTLSDVMTRDPVTAHIEAGVYELSQSMRENGIRRMPLVGDDGELAGIITFDDVFILLSDEIDGLADVVRDAVPPY